MLNNIIFPPDDGKLKQNKRSAAKPFNGIVALLFYGIVGNRLVSSSILLVIGKEMKNYQDSDYVSNKNASGIVYRFVNQTVEVTLEDYLRENPKKTKTDFTILKALSNDDYFAQDRNDYRQTWKNTSIYGLEESDACTVPSPEYYIIEQPEQADRHERRCELAKRAWEKLTRIQQRRYFKYHVEELSTWQIAEIENVNQSKIVKSLAAAEKKIKKALIGS